MFVVFVSEMKLLS